MSLADQIDQASQQRMTARASGNASEAARLTKLIDNLYDKRRRASVEAEHGSRGEIVKRARIEVELERLISRNGE